MVGGGTPTSVPGADARAAPSTLLPSRSERGGGFPACLTSPFQGGDAVEVGAPTKEAGRVPTSDAATAMTAGSLHGITTDDAASVDTLPDPPPKPGGPPLPEREGWEG
jgi:hypothetical protein